MKCLLFTLIFGMAQMIVMAQQVARVAVATDSQVMLISKESSGRVVVDSAIAHSIGVRCLASSGDTLILGMECNDGNGEVEVFSLDKKWGMQLTSKLTLPIVPNSFCFSRGRLFLVGIGNESPRGQIYALALDKQKVLSVIWRYDLAGLFPGEVTEHEEKLYVPSCGGVLEIEMQGGHVPRHNKQFGKSENCCEHISFAGNTAVLTKALGRVEKWTMSKDDDVHLTQEFLTKEVQGISVCGDSVLLALGGEGLMRASIVDLSNRKIIFRPCASVLGVLAGPNEALYWDVNEKHGKNARSELHWFDLIGVPKETAKLGIPGTICALASVE